jgi:predicted house-cleaning noncanonical NTP pyrophosphatase (MazG superfamily)
MEKPEIISQNDKTMISFYTLDESVKSTIQEKLKEIIRKYDHPLSRDHNVDVIYTCLKELMINASKSNIKKTFFIEAQINEQDKELYEKAKTNFKKILTDKYFSYLRDKLRKHHAYVQVEFEEKEEGLVIKVLNNAPLWEEEEKTIREILQKASQATDPNLTLYYTENENNEGAGLGLMLVIHLLKEVGIDPRLFRIGVVEGKTMARIEIPFSPDYEPLRKRP